MTNSLTKTVLNCSTGEVLIVNLTAEEIANLEAGAAKAAQQRAEEEEAQVAAEAAKASAQAKLAALGLTAEEIAALTK